MLQGRISRAYRALGLLAVAVGLVAVASAATQRDPSKPAIDKSPGVPVKVIADDAQGGQDIVVKVEMQGFQKPGYVKVAWSGDTDVLNTTSEYERWVTGRSWSFSQSTKRTEAKKYNLTVRVHKIGSLSDGAEGSCTVDGGG